MEFFALENCLPSKKEIAHQNIYFDKINLKLINSIFQSQI